MQTEYYSDNCVASRVNMLHITRQAVDAAVCRKVLSHVFNDVHHPVNISITVYMPCVFVALKRIGVHTDGPQGTGLSQ